MRSLLLLVLVAGCPAFELSEEAARDPQSCGECHPDHLREWSGSMHAYAAEDPLFLAMNRRGQEETDGALGDFCVRCHAPMAVRLGETTDGLNLDEVDAALKGVTCIFCHTVEAVDGDHNNPLRLAEGTTMRGGLADPLDNPAHPSQYSALHDREQLGSSALCGSCHDIVTPAGVALERTFAEWKGTLFADPENPSSLSCGQCHMDGRDGVAADFEGVRARRVHSHMWPGVDVALTPFPEADAQRAAVQRELYGTVLPTICVVPLGGVTKVTVNLENVGAGHGFPSGAAQDRRVWVEVHAYEGENEVFSSGVVPAGQPVRGTPDPDLWTLGDRLFGADGAEVHMFWEAAAYESTTLPGALTNDPTDPDFTAAHRQREYPIPGAEPDRVTVDVHVRPFGLDVADDLIASGHLDPAVRDDLPTFPALRQAVEWRLLDGRACTD